MPPCAGPSVMLYCTRYPVKTSISPLSIWIGHETMICRLGLVRIRQMPGSRLRMRAAPSNSWSIAPKIGPCPSIRSCRLVESGPAYRGATERVKQANRNVWSAKALAERRGYNAVYEDGCAKRQGALAARDTRARAREVAGARGRLHD